MKQKALQQEQLGLWVAQLENQQYGQKSMCLWTIGVFKTHIFPYFGRMHTNNRSTHMYLTCFEFE